MSSYAQNFLDDITGVNKAIEEATKKTVTIRLDFEQVAHIDALCEVSKMSRNAIIVHLMRIAMEEIYKIGDEDFKKKHQQLMIKHYQSLVDDDKK